jgi:hypothetical protein
MDQFSQADTKISGGTRAICGRHQGILCQQRFKQSIAESIWAVLGKGNDRLVDKLAIMANICNYEWRLDTHAIETEGLSFSACILAMALYNGDTSFLHLYGPNGETDGDCANSEDFEQCLLSAAPNHVIPSWLPSEKLGLRIEDPGNTEWSRNGGRRCVVLNGKLAIEGLLWKVSLFHGLEHLKDQVSKMLDGIHTELNMDVEEDSSESHGTDNSYEEDTAYFPIFQLLVRALVTAERLDILEVVVFACRLIESPHQIPLAISRLEHWANSGTEWPEKEGWDDARNVDSFDNGDSDDDSDGGDYDGDDSDGGDFDDNYPDGSDSDGNQNDKPYTHSPRELQWLYRAIRLGKPLAIGSCVIGDETLTAIFNLEEEGFQRILTPLHQLEYTFASNGLDSKSPGCRYSWCVKDCGNRVEDTDIARLKQQLSVPVDETGRCGYDEPKISPEILDIVGFANGHWSPRLSRVGFLVPDNLTKSWRMDSLGNGKNETK